jgi:hypothetical protein
MVMRRMRSPRSLVACLLAAVTLAFPAAAAGQSAGDDQYSDPFGGGQEEQGDGGAATPAPAPAEPAQTGGGGEPAEAAERPEGRDRLPYTGVDALPLAGAGLLLLGAGVALRVRLE